MTFSVGDYQLGPSLLLQRFGGGDPSCRWEPHTLIRAFWTPEGPCTLALRQVQDQIHSQAVGPGSQWCTAWLPRFFDFPAQELQHCPHPLLKQLSRQWRGLKIGPVPWVFEVAVAYILQQRVTFEEASRSYRQLTYRYGLPAPGPLALKLPLSPQQWLDLGPDRIQQAGVDPKRASTLLRLARLGLQFDFEQLARLRGIGPWTQQSVRGWAWGDPDAVPTGDVHLPHTVCFFLANERRGSDPRMLELLEPYRGCRFRVLAWIMKAESQRAYTAW